MENLPFWAGQFLLPFEFELFPPSKQPSPLPNEALFYEHGTSSYSIELCWLRLIPARHIHSSYMIYRRALNLSTQLLLVLSALLLAFQAQAQTVNWRRLNGPYGGNVIDLLTDTSGTVFVLTADEFATLDPSSGSWEQLISDEHFNNGPSAVFIRNRTDIAISFGSAWFVTEDGGKNWTRAGGGKDIITSGFQIGDTLYGGSKANGVFRTYSSQFLTYWEKVDTSHWPVYSLIRDSSDVWFAGSLGSVYRSTDHGGTWTSLGGLPAVNVTTLVKFGGELVAGTQGSGVFKWSSGSATWVSLNPGTEPWVISSFAIRGGTLFVGSMDAGVFRYNGGTMWTEFNDGLSEQRVSKLFVAPSGAFLAGTTNGLYSQSGSSSRWEAIGLPITQVASLVETPKHSILARTNNGLFRSTDSGEHWTDISINASRAQVVSFAQSTSGTLVAGVGTAFRSRDNGLHWTSSTVAPGGTGIGQVSYVGGHTFLGYSNYHYRSSNDGATWDLQNNLAQTLPIQVSGTGTFIFGTDYRAVYRSVDSGVHWDSIFRSGTVLASGPNVRVFNVSDSGMYKSYYSSDAGYSWQLVSNSDRYIYASANGSSGVYFAAYGGVFRAPNLSAPYSQTAFTNYSTAIATNGPSVVDFDAKHGLFYSVDNGNSWHASQGVYDSVLSLMCDAGGLYFAATVGGIYRSEDSGRTFISASLGLEPTAIYPGNPPNAYGLSVSRNGHVFANAIGRGLAVSTDEGDHWRLVDTTDFAFGGIAFSIAPSGRIFRNLNSGTQDLTYSDDEGASWDTVHQPSLQNLSFDSSGGVIAYYRTSGGRVYVRYSSDNGANWQQIEGLESYGIPGYAAVDPHGQIYLCNLFFGTSEGQHALITTTNFLDTVQHPALDTESVTAIAIDRQGIAYVGGSDLRRTYSYRLYVSGDRGTTWKDSRGPAFPKLQSTICILPTDQYVYAGTDGAGVLRAPRAALAHVTQKQEAKPDVLRTFPNPAGSVATISTSVFGPCTLDVYNVVGVTVAHYEKVVTNIDVNTRALPSGVYSVVATSADRTGTCKLIVRH